MGEVFVTKVEGHDVYVDGRGWFFTEFEGDHKSYPTLDELQKWLHQAVLRRTKAKKLSLSVMNPEGKLETVTGINLHTYALTGVKGNHYGGVVYPPDPKVKRLLNELAVTRLHEKDLESRLGAVQISIGRRETRYYGAVPEYDDMISALETEYAEKAKLAEGLAV